MQRSHRRTCLFSRRYSAVKANCGAKTADVYWRVQMRVEDVVAIGIVTIYAVYISICTRIFFVNDAPTRFIPIHIYHVPRQYVDEATAIHRKRVQHRPMRSRHDAYRRSLALFLGRGGGEPLEPWSRSAVVVQRIPQQARADVEVGVRANAGGALEELELLIHKIIFSLSARRFQLSKSLRFKR